MICERFSVVIVSFPFVDSPAAKPRPALILSNERFNAENKHSVLAMITRAKSTAWPSDYPIVEWEAAGLKADCVVRFKLFTLDNRILRRRIGLLGNADQAACAVAMTEMLGLQLTV